MNRKNFNVDFSKIKAVMFDFDGTITKKGEFMPSIDMVDTLIALAEKGLPIAVCSGRQLESFIRRFGPNFERFSEKAKKYFYIFGENGAVGYHYDIRKKEYVNFYSGTWPRQIPKATFKKALLEASADIAELVIGHNISLVLRPIEALELPIEEVNRISAEIYDFLAKFIENYEVYDKSSGRKYRAKDYLHFGNSGLGCLVCPHDADKDRAIVEFHKYLFGGNCDDGCREILTVGDNPSLHGNDYYFLRGEYGTPFTVGHPEDDLKTLGSCCHCEDSGCPDAYPFKVFDKKGKRLFNSEGTLYLLKEVLKNL